MTKDYARARASLLAAWALKKHWSIAGSLGNCELKLGMHRDAAEHLAYFIREMGKAKEVPPGASEMLAQARSKVGTIEVVTDEPAAEVLLDGTVLGRAPLVDPVFVEPGVHTVVVRRVGSADGPSVTMDLHAGESRRFEAKLNVPADGGAAGKGADAKAPLVPTNEPVEVVPENPHPRTAIVVGGIAGGVVAAGIGAVLLGVASGKASDADATLGQLRADGVLCTSPPQAGSCSDLLSLREGHDTFANVAKGMFVGAGVLLAGTAGYVVWSKTAGAKAAALWTAPAVGPRGGGLWVGGAF